MQQPKDQPTNAQKGITMYTRPIIHFTTLHELLHALPTPQPQSLIYIGLQEHRESRKKVEPKQTPSVDLELLFDDEDLEELEAN